MGSDNPEFSAWERRVRLIVAEEHGEELPEDIDAAIKDFWVDALDKTPIEVDPAKPSFSLGLDQDTVERIRERLTQLMAVPPIQGNASDNFGNNLWPSTLNGAATNMWLKAMASDAMETIPDVKNVSIKVSRLADYSSRDAEVSIKYSAVEDDMLRKEIPVPLGYKNPEDMEEGD